MRRRPLLLALALVVAATGCVSTPKDRSTISLRRANLSLAFTDPSLAEPAPIEVIQRIIPVDVPTPAIGGRPTTRPFVFPQVELCPAVAEGARPEEPAILKVSRPREGTYIRLNEGTITLSSGTLELKLGYPPVTMVEVRNVRDVDSENFPGVPALGVTRWTHFEVFEQLVPGVSELIEYRYDANSIEMVRRETTTPESGPSVFEPQPPVRVLALASPGTTWQSVGVDDEARVARAVSGTVGGPERVDLCGQVVEAIPATLEVQNASLEDAATSGVYGTEAGKPLVQQWLPQYGALLARQEIHSSEFVRTPEGVVRVTYDVVSRLRSTEPVA
jgi:hypothetical protein